MISKTSLSYFVLKLLVVLTAIQFSSVGISDKPYTILRILIISLILFLFYIYIDKSITQISKHTLILNHFKILLISALIIVPFLPFKNHIPITPIRDLLLSLIIILIGLNVNLEKRKYLNLVKFYIILFTFSALSIVFSYSSGFEIKEQYLPVPKNQISPAFGVAFVLSLYQSFKEIGISKMLYLTLMVLLFASLLVIRGRAVIIAVLFTSVFFIFFYIKNRLYKYLIFVISLILFPFIGKYIFDALFLNYDTSSIESISTGRITTYIAGFYFLKDHLVAGQLEAPFITKSNIHNYILFNIVNYGIFLGSFILIVFFKYATFIYHHIKKNKYKHFEVGPLAMVVLFIVSFFEYTYPFSPGSAIFFPFFLLGQFLQYKIIQNDNKNIQQFSSSL